MGVWEIGLLIAGVIILILGFLLPERQEEQSPHTKELAKDEIRRLVSEEMESVKSHVEDVVDESIEYAMEKTERSLERLSNEKIMAVSEYSDTVLKEIHKNHEEVMFLYDMLNDKHINLKNTVSQVNQTVKAVEETTKEAEAVMSTIKELPATQIPEKPDFKPYEPPKVERSDKVMEVPEPVKEEKEIKFPGNLRTDEVRRNKNEQILMMHKQGKSTVSIAKELNLGVGEVKLVIDLYKNL